MLQIKVEDGKSIVFTQLFSMLIGNIVDFDFSLCEGNQFVIKKSKQFDITCVPGVSGDFLFVITGETKEKEKQIGAQVLDVVGNKFGKVI